MVSLTTTKQGLGGLGSTEWGILAIAVLAACLRFYHLDAFSLWEDELYSVGMVSLTGSWYSGVQIGKHQHLLTLPDSFWTWKLADQHPPLYEILLAAWVKLFGTSDVAVRGMSALCGVLTVMTALLLPRQLGALPRLVYALLLTFSGVLLVYSQEARGYILGSLCCAGMAVLACRQSVLDEARWAEGRPVWGVLVFAGLLGLTHYYGALMAASFAIVMSLQTRSVAAFVRSSVRWTLAFVPMLVYIGLGWRGILTKVDAAGASVSLFVSFRRVLVHLVQAFTPQWGLAGFWLVLIVVALAWSWSWLRQRQAQVPATPTRVALGRLGAVLLCFLLLMALATKKGEFFHPRYMIFAIPVSCLLLSLAVGLFSGGRRLAAAVLVLALAPTSYTVWDFSPTAIGGRNWRGMSQSVASAYQTGDVVVAPIAAIRIVYAHYLNRYLTSTPLDAYLLSPNDPGQLGRDLAARASRPRQVILVKDVSNPGLAQLGQQMQDYLQKEYGCGPGQTTEVMTFRVLTMPCALPVNR